MEIMQEFNVQDAVKRLYKKNLKMKKLKEEYDSHFGPFGEEILYKKNHPGLYLQDDSS